MNKKQIYLIVPSNLVINNLRMIQVLQIISIYINNTSVKWNFGKVETYNFGKVQILFSQIIAIHSKTKVILNVFIVNKFLKWL